MNRIIRLSVGCAMAVALFYPSLAAAQAQFETDNDMLRQGLQLYEDLEYERAVEALSAALLEPGNSVAERLMIFQTLGTLYTFLNRQQEAQLALTRLLCVDQSFSFGEYASPRIREVFNRVREQWISEGRPCEELPTEAVQEAPVNMDHESPREAEPGSPIELRIVIEDPELRVNSVVLHYRATGEEGFNETPATMTSPGTFTAEIPTDVVQPPAAEYFIQAVSDEGHPLAALGTSRAPLRIPVSGGRTGGTSIARSWWFWTIIGTVVVGAGLGLGLGLGLNQGPENDGNGSLTIRICDGETGTCPSQ